MMKLATGVSRQLRRTTIWQSAARLWLTADSVAPGRCSEISQHPPPHETLDLITGVGGCRPKRPLISNRSNLLSVGIMPEHLARGIDQRGTRHVGHFETS